jgi:hypothetical protein
MPTESFAACVARHSEMLDEFALLLIRQEDAVERARIVKLMFKSTAEMDRQARLRLEASEHEFQRREAKKLVELVRVVAPRAGR